MIEKQYQTFWPRLKAGIIDAIIFCPFSMIAELLRHKSNSDFLILSWDQFQMWSWVAYSVLMHGLKGQTIGKKFCNVKVFDISGGLLSLRQAFMRDIILVISSAAITTYVFINPGFYIDILKGNVRDVGLMPREWLIFSMTSLVWCVLEFITMLTNSKRRAIHDFIAGSIVKRVDEKT